MNKVLRFIKDFISPTSFGLMVVNCNYFRPMSSGQKNFSHRYLNDEQYFELCEQIKSSK